jgi:O-antigen/teichoic acid export membrane protein
VAVRLFYADYAQVGYFGLANNVYLTISIAFSQFTTAFVPFMMTLQAQGEIETLRQWAKRLIDWLTAGTMFVVFGVLLLGNDLVPLILGAAYRPVAANLLPLSLTLWFQALGNVAILLTIVYNHPKKAVLAAGIRLAAMWGFGPFLVAKWGSLGGCFAVLLASAVYSSYFTWRMQGVMPSFLKNWMRIIALGFVFLPLAWLRSSWSVNILLYGLFVVGYITLLFLSRCITIAEVIGVGRALRSKSGIFAGSQSAGHDYLER